MSMVARWGVGECRSTGGLRRVKGGDKGFPAAVVVLVMVEGEEADRVPTRAVKVGAGLRIEGDASTSPETTIHNTSNTRILPLGRDPWEGSLSLPFSCLSRKTRPKLTI